LLKIIYVKRILHDFIAKHIRFVNILWRHTTVLSPQQESRKLFTLFLKTFV